MSENEKLFPYPFTVDTLPPHRAREMTQAQRDALPAFELRPDFPGKGFLSLGTPDEGRFVLYPERMNGDDPMTEVKFYVHGGEDVRNLTERKTMSPQDSDLSFRAFSGYEVGTVWSQAKAVELLDHARRHAFEASAEEQLLAAGFEAQQTPGVYRKPAGRDSFSFILKPESTWLMFEPRNKTYWHNLFILKTHEPWYSDKGVSPILWPDTFNDPSKTLAGLAVHMTEIWSPDLLPGRSAKRRAKP